MGSLGELCGILLCIKLEKGKEWYKSKTLWINAVLLVALVIELTIDATTAAKVTGFLLPIVNIILRSITTQGVSR